MSQDRKRLEEETAGAERPKRPRGLSAAYLEQALESLYAAGHPPSLYPIRMRRPTKEESESQRKRRLWLREMARHAQMRHCWTSALFAAFAAEAYVNEFLRGHLSARDVKAIDRLSTPDKFVVGTKLAYGETLFRHGDEAMAPIKQLFALRHKLVHPRPGFGPGRLFEGTGKQAPEFERVIEPVRIAGFVIAVAGAGFVLGRRVYGFRTVDLHAQMIWFGRPAVIAYAERASVLPEPYEKAEPKLIEQAWDHVNKLASR